MNASETRVQLKSLLTLFVYYCCWQQQWKMTPIFNPNPMQKTESKRISFVMWDILKQLRFFLLIEINYKEIMINKLVSLSRGSSWQSDYRGNLWWFNSVKIAWRVLAVKVETVELKTGAYPKIHHVNIDKITIGLAMLHLHERERRMKNKINGEKGFEFYQG